MDDEPSGSTRAEGELGNVKANSIKSQAGNSTGAAQEPLIKKAGSKQNASKQRSKSMGAARAEGTAIEGMQTGMQTAGGSKAGESQTASKRQRASAPPPVHAPTAATEAKKGSGSKSNSVQKSAGSVKAASAKGTTEQPANGSTIAGSQANSGKTDSKKRNRTSSNATEEDTATNSKRSRKNMTVTNHAKAVTQSEAAVVDKPGVVENSAVAGATSKQKNAGKSAGKAQQAAKPAGSNNKAGDSSSTIPTAALAAQETVQAVNQPAKATKNTQSNGHSKPAAATAVAAPAGRVDTIAATAGGRQNGAAAGSSSQANGAGARPVPNHKQLELAPTSTAIVQSRKDEFTQLQVCALHNCLPANTTKLSAWSRKCCTLTGCCPVASCCIGNRLPAGDVQLFEHESSLPSRN